jgi:MFS family permease
MLKKIRGSRILNLLKNRNFFLILLSQVISLLGSNLHFFAILWYMVEKYNSSTTIGIYILTTMIPYILFGSLAGLMVDIWDRKKIMYVIDILNSFLVLTIPILDYLGYLSVHYIYFISFLITTLDLFYSPAKQAIVPHLVLDEDLIVANSILQTSDSVLKVVIPAFSGIISSILSFKMIFIIDSASYIISSICIYSIIYDFHSNLKLSHLKINGMIQELNLGLKFILETPLIIFILSISIILNVLSAPMNTLAIIVVKNVLNLNVKFFGYLQAGLSFGFIIGAIILNILKKNSKLDNIQVTILGCIFLTVGLLLFSFSSIFVTAVCAFFIFGISFCLCSVCISTIRQQVVPNNKLGRVAGTSDVIVMLFMSISAWLSGFLADLIGVQNVFLYSGVLIGIFTFFLAFILRKIKIS